MRQVNRVDSLHGTLSGSAADDLHSHLRPDLGQQFPQDSAFIFALGEHTGAGAIRS